MRILIVEDDLASRKIMLKILSKYGECDVTVDGLEAVDAFMLAQKENKPYDLVCLDIMMPKLDGVNVLKVIRSLEDKKNYCIIFEQYMLECYMKHIDKTITYLNSSLDKTIAAKQGKCHYLTHKKDIKKESQFESII